MRKFIVSLAMLFASFGAAADQTIFQAVTFINLNGDANLTYYRGPGAWGASGCPNATYVQVKAETSGRKEILSIALAAKMSGRRIQFWGNCDTNDPTTFNAFYIIVE